MLEIILPVLTEVPKGCLFGGKILPPYHEIRGSSAPTWGLGILFSSLPIHQSKNFPSGNVVWDLIAHFK